jgi:hypothetical protein
MSTVDVEITIERKGRRKPRRETATRIPRIARLMALAIKFQEMVDCREVLDYADLARLGYVSRARLTQIMNLQLLAPDIQEMLLFLPLARDRHGTIREQMLRPLCTETAWDLQRCAWSGLPVHESMAIVLQT